MTTTQNPRLIRGPGAALRFHLDLYERVAESKEFFVKGKVGQMMPDQFTQRCNLATSLGLGAVNDGDSVMNRRDQPHLAFSRPSVEKAMGMVNAEYTILNEGETHYVTRHVMDTIAEAATEMEPEALWPTDLPARQGLIVFESPLLADDLHPDTGEEVPGLVMPIRAIGWGVHKVWVPRDPKHGFIDVATVNPDAIEARDGITYTVYSTVDDWEHWYLPAYTRLVPEHPMERTVADGARQLGVWLSDISGWAFGNEWNSTVMGPGVAQRRKWLLTYWRWTWQRILRSAVYRPTRPEYRAAMRSGRPIEDGNIKVVHLRREEPALHLGHREWQDALDYRVVVRGHWRRQWCRSLGPARNEDGSFNHESHRLVWVEPFIRGSRGPLVRGHNVSVAVR